MNIILILFLISIDQITKYIVKNKLIINTSITIIPNFFDITYVENDGVAFSFLKGSRYFIIIFTFVILIFLIYNFIKNDFSKKEKLILLFLISGIIGNLIDRIINKRVIDFLSFKIFNYYFPIFNIADIFITISCLIYIVFLMKVKK